MQGSVYIPKIVQLHHPSGELYDSYRQFADAHPDANWFQSDAFFRFVALWPEAKPILLVAFRDEALKDPGRRFSKVQDPGQQDFSLRSGQTPNQPQTTQNAERRTHHPTQNPSTSSQSTQNAERKTQNLKGSLLAVVIEDSVPRMLNFFPLAGLYKRFTTRTVVYGGPLLAEGRRLEREMTLKALLGSLHDTAGKQSLFTQFRNFSDLTEYIPLFHAQKYRYHDRLNLLVDTPDKDTAWKNMSATRRRQVRKSLANGAEIIYNPSSAEIDQFYDILKTLYRKKVRKPLPSRTFFHALNPNSAKPKESCELSVESCQLNSQPTTHNSQPTSHNSQPTTHNSQLTSHTTILVQHNNRIIGGIACPILPGKAMYEWYVCGLDREYKPHDIYPSVLATWAAIDYAAENGIPTFDFMGLGKPDEKYGVRDFKARFGGKWVNYGRFSRVNKRVFYAVAEIVYNVKRLIMR